MSSQGYNYIISLLIPYFYIFKCYPNKINLIIQHLKNVDVYKPNPLTRMITFYNKDLEQKDVSIDNMIK